MPSAWHTCAAAQDDVLHIAAPYGSSYNVQAHLLALLQDGLLGVRQLFSWQLGTHRRWAASSMSAHSEASSAASGDAVSAGLSVTLNRRRSWSTCGHGVQFRCCIQLRNEQDLAARILQVCLFDHKVYHQFQMM